MLGRSLEISFLSCVALSSPATGYLPPLLPTHVGTILLPLWSNFAFNPVRYCLEKSDYSGGAKMCKYQLRSWGIDWWCWRVATLSVPEIRDFLLSPLRWGLLCLRLCHSRIMYQEVFKKIRSRFRLFPHLLLKVALRAGIWMPTSPTSILARCIPILKNF